MELSAVMGATARQCLFVREYGASYGDMPPIPLSLYEHTPVVLRLGSTADIEIDHCNVSRQRDTFCPRL